jgi:hypothetical protein
VLLRPLQGLGRQPGVRRGLGRRRRRARRSRRDARRARGERVDDGGVRRGIRRVYRFVVARDVARDVLQAEQRFFRGIGFLPGIEL